MVRRYISVVSIRSVTPVQPSVGQVILAQPAATAPPLPRLEMPDGPGAPSVGRMPATSVLWFRRDLRLGDHPGLLAAADAGTGGVLPLFVVDPALWEPAGPARRAYLLRSLAALDASLGGRLHLLHGDPAVVVPRIAAGLRAATVHVSADFGPYGSARDAAVETTLARDGR